MPIRLWPKDYAKKDHISQGEKILLRNAARNLKEGHFAVDIDPVRMSTNVMLGWIGWKSYEKMSLGNLLYIRVKKSLSTDR